MATSFPFSPEQTDEEVLATVIAHYFLSDELVCARELALTESYEAAITYLSTCAQQSLRNSAEERPPRVYTTIPGGELLFTILPISFQHLPFMR